MLKQQRLHLRLQQKLTLSRRHRPPRHKRIQGKPLPLRRPDRRMQIIVTQRQPMMRHRKLPAHLLQKLRPPSLRQPLILRLPVRPVKQPVHIHIQKPLPRHHRRRITQNQQHRTPQLPLPGKQLRHQPVQHLNRRRLIPMNPGRHNQRFIVHILPPGRRCQPQHAVGLP